MCRRSLLVRLFPFVFVVLVLIAGSTPAFPQHWTQYWNPLEIIEGISDINGSSVEVSQELIAKRRKRIREIVEELGQLPEPGMDSRTCVKEAERLYKEGLELSKWIAEAHRANLFSRLPGLQYHSYKADELQELANELWQEFGMMVAGGPLLKAMAKGLKYLATAKHVQRMRQSPKFKELYKEAKWLANNTDLSTEQFDKFIGAAQKVYDDMSKLATEASLLKGGAWTAEHAEDFKNLQDIIDKMKKLLNYDKALVQLNEKDRKRFFQGIRLINKGEASRREKLRDALAKALSKCSPEEGGSLDFQLVNWDTTPVELDHSGGSLVKNDFWVTVAPPFGPGGVTKKDITYSFTVIVELEAKDPDGHMVVKEVRDEISLSGPTLASLWKSVRIKDRVKWEEKPGAHKPRKFPLTVKKVRIEDRKASYLLHMSKRIWKEHSREWEPVVARIMVDPVKQILDKSTPEEKKVVDSATETTVSPGQVCPGESFSVEAVLKKFYSDKSITSTHPPGTVTFRQNSKDVGEQAPQATFSAPPEEGVHPIDIKLRIGEGVMPLQEQITVASCPKGPKVGRIGGLPPCGYTLVKGQLSVAGRAFGDSSAVRVTAHTNCNQVQGYVGTMTLWDPQGNAYKPAQILRPVAQAPSRGPATATPRIGFGFGVPMSRGRLHSREEHPTFHSREEEERYWREREREESHRRDSARLGAALGALSLAQQLAQAQRKAPDPCLVTGIFNLPEGVTDLTGWQLGVGVVNPATRAVTPMVASFPPCELSSAVAKKRTPLPEEPEPEE